MCIYIRDRNTFFSVIFSLNLGDYWVLFAYLFTHMTSHHVGKLYYLVCDNYLFICHLFSCIIPGFLTSCHTFMHICHTFIHISSGILGVQMF